MKKKNDEHVKSKNTLSFIDTLPKTPKLYY